MTINRLTFRLSPQNIPKIFECIEQSQSSIFGRCSTLCYTADVALLRQYIISSVIHLVVTAPSHPYRHTSVIGGTWMSSSLSYSIMTS